MKSTRFFILTLLSVFSFSLAVNHVALAQNPEVSYYRNISQVYEPIKKDTWDYMKKVAKDRSARRIEKKRQQLLETIKEGERIVQKIRKRDNDFGLKDSVTSYLKTSYYIIDHDYQRIIDMEAVADESYDAMEAYILANERANDKMDKKFDDLRLAQDAYAAHYNITLVEDESRLAEKMDKAGEAFDYYNDVYLVFFKCNFQESKMSRQITEKDVTGAQQSKNALATYIEEGREKLKRIGPYSGDNSLLMACRELFRFYENEIENDISVFTDFILQEEAFQKMRTEFENMKKRERTREIVDEYNQAVNDFNEAVNTFNNTSNRLNKEREGQMDAWNKAVERFLKKHAV